MFQMGPVPSDGSPRRFTVTVVLMKRLNEKGREVYNQRLCTYPVIDSIFFSFHVQQRKGLLLYSCVRRIYSLCIEFSFLFITILRRAVQFFYFL